MVFATFRISLILHRALEGFLQFVINEPITNIFVPAFFAIFIVLSSIPPSTSIIFLESGLKYI